MIFFFPFLCTGAACSWTRGSKLAGPELLLQAAQHAPADCAAAATPAGGIPHWSLLGRVDAAGLPVSQVMDIEVTSFDVELALWCFAEH